MIKQALREFVTRLPLMGRGLGLVWRAARPWTIVWGFLLLLQGLAPAALVYLTRITVDKLATALATRDALGAFASAWPPTRRGCRCCSSAAPCRGFGPSGTSFCASTSGASKIR